MYRGSILHFPKVRYHERWSLNSDWNGARSPRFHTCLYRSVWTYLFWFILKAFYPASSFISAFPFTRNPRTSTCTRMCYIQQCFAWIIIHSTITYYVILIKNVRTREKKIWNMYQIAPFIVSNKQVWEIASCIYILLTVFHIKYSYWIRFQKYYVNWSLAVKDDQHENG